MKRFPAGRYGRQRLEFFPAPYHAPLRAFAALVFPWVGDQVLLCDIEDRGWCIPSGRVEPNEEPCEAAYREAVEEAGAILHSMQYIGCYRISERGEVRWADVFVAGVKDLVEITCPNESRGRKLVSPDILPSIYHMWNPLMEEMFVFSKEVLERQLRIGDKGLLSKLQFSTEL
ncbi:MAG: NUDIX domain-containing protein [Armatimonadetes bacterium]|nr:NUDIX domain-containing protein [Armatimonadota bacterium]